MDDQLVASSRSAGLDICEAVRSLLSTMGVDASAYTAGTLTSRTPLTGAVVARPVATTPAQAAEIIAGAATAFSCWRLLPAPARGELIRLFGLELRSHKAGLGRLVSIEAGKVVSEGLGEVQEMIDICDFAVGLSRQLYGLTIATERPEHRMMETWHPLGVVGIISAFNFPVAVWAWNAALALVCGNSVVWKPSEKALLTALAVQALLQRAIQTFRAAGGDAPDGLSGLLTGKREIGAMLVEDPRVPLVSATGSTAMGRSVGPKLAARFARSILELGGNNAAIVCPSADLELTLRGVVFAAMGTAGQRCTSLRRLFVHDSVYDAFLPRLKQAYASVSVGSPLDGKHLVGPLIDQAAYDAMCSAITSVVALGAAVTGGERVFVEECPDAFYVRPAIVEVDRQYDIVKTETFAPILYVLRFSDVQEAVRLQNDVPQGLSSSIFTNDLREAEMFLSVRGSDCGIANVNIGPSGAEIGGAFGGEKETGGGRESGSDAWKAYMRRATNTINFGRSLPLAQGVVFEV